MESILSIMQQVHKKTNRISKSGGDLFPNYYYHDWNEYYYNRLYRGLESFKGDITTGNIAEFIIYVNMLAWPVASVGWVTSIIQRAAASQQRINNFLLIKPEIQNKISDYTKINGDIHFENVSFTYNDTKIKALKDISFTIKDGSSLGIFGKPVVENQLLQIYYADFMMLKKGILNLIKLI